MAETARGGPFNEILDHDIFVNCIYLSSPIPPFITKDMLASPGRRLTVLSDVSCDATNPNNPVPVYYGASTFDDPVIRVSVPESAPLDVVAIDHLPTLLPLESSEAFCKDLLPSLLALREMDSSRVWTDAADLFRAKCTEAAL
nr:Saccharopine dehydrogenase [Polyrhizophydium stewartii]